MHMSCLLLMLLMPAQVASESAKPEPRVALSERGKLSYTVDIDSGNVVLRVPRNWSVQTQTQHRKQDSYDGIDADFRSFWEVEHSLYGVALLQEMVHEDGEVKLHQIRVVDLKLEDEKFPSAAAAAKARFDDLQNMGGPNQLYRKVIPLRIDGRTFHEFRLLTRAGQLQRHLFVESNGTIYHISTSTAYRHSNEPTIGRVLTRIKLAPERTD